MVQPASSRGGFRGTPQAGFRGTRLRGISRGGMLRTANIVLQPRLPHGVDLRPDNVGDTSNEPPHDNTYYVTVRALCSGSSHMFPLKCDGAWLSPDGVPYRDIISGRYLATPSQDPDTALGYPLWYDVHDLMPETVGTTRPV